MTSAPPASMRVRSSGRVAWCSRVSIWCPVSNTCTEGALVEKQATEPRTSSGSPIYGRFGALGVFFCPRTRSLPVPRAQLLPQHTVTFGGRSNRTVPDPTPYDPERPECTDSLANTAADKCHAAIADPGHVHAVRAQEHARTNATAHFQRLRQWRPALHLRIDLARPFRSTEFPFETVLLKNASV